MRGQHTQPANHQTVVASHSMAARPCCAPTLAYAEPPRCSTASTKHWCSSGDQRSRSLLSMITRSSGACGAAGCGDAAACECAAVAAPETATCTGASSTPMASSLLAELALSPVAALLVPAAGSTSAALPCTASPALQPAALGMGWLRTRAAHSQAARAGGRQASSMPWVTSATAKSPVPAASWGGIPDPEAIGATGSTRCQEGERRFSTGGMQRQVPRKRWVERVLAGRKARRLSESGKCYSQPAATDSSSGATRACCQLCVLHAACPSGQATRHPNQGPGSSSETWASPLLIVGRIVAPPMQPSPLLKQRVKFIQGSTATPAGRRDTRRRRHRHRMRVQARMSQTCQKRLTQGVGSQGT